MRRVSTRPAATPEHMPGSLATSEYGVHSLHIDDFTFISVDVKRDFGRAVRMARVGELAGTIVPFPTDLRLESRGMFRRISVSSQRVGENPFTRDNRPDSFAADMTTFDRIH